MTQYVPKTCILCKHFHFDEGDPGYSEMTPGWLWSAGCQKNKWEMSGSNYPTEEEYRKNMLKAETCELFELSNDAKRILKEGS